MPTPRAVIQQRWRAFAGEYIKHFNGRRAIEECGCYKSKGRSAEIRAIELLRNPTVRGYVSEAIEKRIKRTEIEQDRVLYEIASLAFSDLRSVASWDSNAFILTPSDQLTDEAASAIAEVGVEVYETETERGLSRRIKHRVKMHNKLEALDKLARHVGLYEADNKRVLEFGVAHLPESVDAEHWDASVDREMQYAKQLNSSSSRDLESE